MKSGKSAQKEHILVCLSSAPSNEHVIRTAARLAKALKAAFTALYVETQDYSVASSENKKRLQQHRLLAERLGAKCEVIYGEDIAYQIAEYARFSEVTRIILGQSRKNRISVFSSPTLEDRLLSYMPDAEIHILPDKDKKNKTYLPRKTLPFTGKGLFLNIFWSLLILLLATLISSCFYQLHFTNANIIMVYILGVLLTSIATSHQIYSLVSSIASVFIFNYLFTVPRFTLNAYETGYPVTFIVMFLTAYITGTFAIRYKEQARQSATIARRYKILLDTSQLLAKASGNQGILNLTAQQIIKLLQRNLVIYTCEDQTLSSPVLFPAEPRKSFPYNQEKEEKVIHWVLANNHLAGASTAHFPDADFLYLSIRVNDRVYGILGIEGTDFPLDSSEYSILLSILGECALALDSEKNARDKEAAAVLAEREQLRATLLRSISHDLRTPLTSISGHASNLLRQGDCFDQKTRQHMLQDIYDDSLWLIELVENLLYATRIEDGRMILNTSTELLSDIIAEAVRHMKPKAEHHQLSFQEEDDFIFVNADTRMILQVLINIIDNALKYTPVGSKIHISSRSVGDMAEICIADNGPGISGAEKEHIFEKFYSGNHSIADNRRSIGLGLFLCKSIVEAHGGTITVADNTPSGAVFSFTLPIKDLSPCQLTAT
ncbi:MAG: DUF4118 domain-containing protein [Lachnospiraceae bacterium]|nr:DUF4118 domain-containing protein [Lachnospiraceae bacterium]